MCLFRASRASLTRPACRPTRSQLLASWRAAPLSSRRAMRSTQESGTGEPASEVAGFGADALEPAPLYAEGPVAEGPAAEAEEPDAEELAAGGLAAPLGAFLAAAAARAAAAPGIAAGVCGAVVPAASEASPDAPGDTPAPTDGPVLADARVPAPPVAAARAAAAPPPVGTLADEAPRGCSASPSGRNAIIRNSVISNPDRGSGARARSRRPVMAV
jgi:hypothetical protein